MTTGLIYKLVFQAVNAIGNSMNSNTVQYALVDVPIAPGVPEIILSLTSEDQIAVQWSPIISTQSPGSKISGYLLEMMDTDNLDGVFNVVFDGTVSYPDITNFLTTNITSGRNYIFRVSGHYQNGMTSFS